MVTTRRVKTARLEVHARFAGDPGGIPLVLVHGNVSDSRFWGEVLKALPAGTYGVAPDLRAYGETEAKPIDGTRGMRDFADDVWSLCDALGFDRVVLVGHSMGGGVVQQMTIDQPARVRGLVLEGSAGPYGFGGTKDAQGTPCWDDFAGSGGGVANAEFVARLAKGERDDVAISSPRRVLTNVCMKQGTKLDPAWEEELLSSMLSTRVGDDFVPGDKVASANWPGAAPGARGLNNALSPKYMNTAALAEVSPKAPVLWVRGTHDAIVSDTSLSDLGYLGKLGVVPGWPGEEKFPPQPMVSQLRAVLDRYTTNGGRYREAVIEECGHCPHVEKFGEFQALLSAFVAEITA